MRRTVVLGLGSFGFALAKTLAQLGEDVLAVDRDQERVNAIDRDVSAAMCLDFTNEVALREAGIGHADLAIVAVGDDIQNSLLVCALLKKLGVPEIWGRAINDAQAQVLEALKVDRIMNFERDMALNVAHLVASPGTETYLQVTPLHVVAEIVAQPEMVGKTLMDLDFRNRYGVLVVAIRSGPGAGKDAPKDKTGEDPGEERASATGAWLRRPTSRWSVSEVINQFPGPNDALRSEDRILVIGTTKSVISLQKAAAKHEL